MRNGSIQVSDGWDRLSTLRDGGTHVTYLTDDLLAYEGEDARRDFLSENKEKVMRQPRPAGYSTATVHLAASKVERLSRSCFYHLVWT
jgi:hypothetical protein